MSENGHEAQKSSVALRPSWGQVAIMFVCAIPVIVIVAGIATVIPFIVEKKSWGWFVLVVPLSPGWLWPALLASHGDSPGFNYDDLFTALFVNFTYWFVWIFWFVLRFDRRWRQKHAARFAG